MKFKFMKLGKGFPTLITCKFILLFAMNCLHVLVNVRRTKHLVTDFTFFCFGFSSKMSLDMIFEILNFVDSSVTQWTLEPGHRVVSEAVLPVSVDSGAGLGADWTPAGHTVPLMVGVRDEEARVSVSHVVSDKLCYAGAGHLAPGHIALSAPAMIVLHVTHQVAVV